MALFGGRTALQIYSDCISTSYAFAFVTEYFVSSHVVTRRHAKLRLCNEFLHQRRCARSSSGTDFPPPKPLMHNCFPRVELSDRKVGMGPSGELRYPSYQEGKWTYCGIGEYREAEFEVPTHGRA
jgi:hypothetical protein